MGLDYLAENASERRRLHALAEVLSDRDLASRLDNGLSVAGVLMHLAFWDNYVNALLERWEQTGLGAVRSDYDAVNAAIIRLEAVVAPRHSLELALQAADSVDSHVEALPADLAAAIIDGGSERMLRRAAHRRHHLDQIEQVIRSA